MKKKLTKILIGGSLVVLFFVGVKFAQAADGCCYYTDNGGGCTTTKIKSECDIFNGTLYPDKDCNDDRTSCVDSTNTGSGNPPAATGSDPQGCCYWSLTDPNTGQQGELHTNDTTRALCQKDLEAARKSNPGWTLIGNWTSTPCSGIVVEADRDDPDAGSGSGGNSSVKANLGGLSSTASGAGYTQRSIVEIISKILKALLSFVGVIFFILLIYGGVTFMTAAGNETQAKNAKGIITAAVIGLVVVIIAYAITTFVADSIIL